MKTNNTDSTANVSRFARDKRQRINSSERVERSPRQRREGDNEGQREYRPRVAKTEKRSSFNPHFTSDNRLRPEYEATRREERGERNERNERSFNRTERSDRGGFKRNERSERGGYNRTERGERGECNFNRADRTERNERGERNFNRADRTERTSKGGSRSQSAERTSQRGGTKRGYTSKRDEKPRSYPKYNPNRGNGEIRLNRFISQSGVCSRREADDFILAGVVTVNGQVVTELGTKILPTDEVRFNDEKLQGEKHVYIVLNKPKGYVTSLDDPYADKTDCCECNCNALCNFPVSNVKLLKESTDGASCTVTASKTSCYFVTEVFVKTNFWEEFNADICYAKCCCSLKVSYRAVATEGSKNFWKVAFEFAFFFWWFVHTVAKWYGSKDWENKNAWEK